MLRLPGFATPAIADKQALPRVAPRAVGRPILSAQAWAELPAHAALAVALGAGATALVHAVDLPDFTWRFWLLTLVGLAFCIASHWDRYPRQKRIALNVMITARRILGAGTAFCLFALPSLCIALKLPGSQWFVPTEALADGNLLAAVFMGWIMLAGAFAVSATAPRAAALTAGGEEAGHSDGTSSPLPLALPLLPELSLFGLLNVVSVDTIISVCFLLFAAAGLYVVAYEGHLKRRSLSTSPSPLSPPSRGRGVLAAGSGPGVATSAGPLVDSIDSEGSIARAQRVAGQYLLLCGVWLGIFAIGAAMFYYPLMAVLPLHISGGFSRAQAGPQSLLSDWRSPSQIMRLRGGSYPLSDREVMRISVEDGAPSGLWRGRAFERYADLVGSGSQWEELPLGEGSFKALRPEAGVPIELKPPLAAEVAGALRRHIVVETVRSLIPRGDHALHASGEPLMVQSAFRRLNLMADGTVSTSGRYSSMDDVRYTVRSQVTRPHRAALTNAAGLTRQQRREWSNDPARAALLQTGSARTTQRLNQIAAQIVNRARARGQALATPYQKLRAIEDYLVETCEYSLDTPVVPDGQDAVLFFLTESRLGACDMFASAMALLLRAMDVPTRVAAGFRQPQDPQEADNTAGSAASNAPGDVPGDASSAGSPQAGSFVVREKDAHAWVEYYVDGFGWLPHDPTDGTREAQPSVGQQLAQMLQLQQLRSPRLLLLPGAGMALLLVGALWTVLEKRGACGVPKRAASAEEAGRARIAAAHAAAVQILAGRVPPLKLGRSARTPHELEAAVLRAPLPPAAKQEFAALTYLFIAAHYAADFPAAQVDAAQLRACLSRLRRALG